MLSSWVRTQSCLHGHCKKADVLLQHSGRLLELGSRWLAGFFRRKKMKKKVIKTRVTKEGVGVGGDERERTILLATYNTSTVDKRPVAPTSASLWLLHTVNAISAQAPAAAPWTAKPPPTGAFSPSAFFFATLTATVAFGSLFFDFFSAAPCPVLSSGFRLASLRAREVDRAPLPRADRAGDLLFARPFGMI